MEPRYRFRLFILTALVLLGCGSLLSRLYEFQIERRAEFVANIPTTHTVTVREPAIRGEIVDRKGITLAENRRSYEVVFNLEDIYKSYKEQNTEEPVLLENEALLGAGGMPQQTKQKDIVRIVNDWVIPKLENLGLEGARYTRALKSHYLTHGGLVPYVYETDLTQEQFARIAVRSNELPGIEVRVMPRRLYPQGSLACHVLGQVKQWEKGDIPTEYTRSSRMHFQGDDKGYSGVEATMDTYLRGVGGKRILVRNEKRKVIATEDYQPAREGAQVRLTIDARLQFIVETVLRRIGRGAAVVMDPNTGEVLAMASVPNFDPNDFIPSISRERWAAYNSNKGDPFVNRALSPYLPGSTFKLPTALAGILNGRVNERRNCIGFSQYGSLKIRCWKTTGHGTLGLSEAIQRSCNPYFMDMASSLRSKVMVDTFSLLGFGDKTGILLPGEDPGVVPGSRIWRQEIKPGASMTPAALGLMAIGQGDSLATPLQICNMTVAIANGGICYQPRIIKEVIGIDLSGERQILKEDTPIRQASLLDHGATAKQIETVRQGMWKAVNQQGGTAGRVALPDLEIAAKTGTAQTGQPDNRDKNNAWTTSFAPYDSPRYAVTVMVRNGRSGGKVAGTLSHLIYRGIFALEAGLNPPLSKLGVYDGNFLAYEDIELPEGELIALPIADQDPSGDLLDQELLQSGEPIKVKPNTLPLPTIAPQPDR